MSPVDFKLIVQGQLWAIFHLTRAQRLTEEQVMEIANALCQSAKEVEW